ncbi:MAG: leucine-rich repeat protein [Lachnospiraceae bacterium]|nr:leucine-rich repeat protein [Lachnospiraceae bacterium]
MSFKRRFLTVSLAAAMAVTSLPGQMAGTVKAAGLAAGLEPAQADAAAVGEEALADMRHAVRGSLYVSFPGDQVTQETTKSVRANGTATFKVYVDINNDDVYAGADFQWYSVKGGVDTKLDGEITDTYKVRVADYNTSYKCVVTPRLQEGASQEAQKSQTCIFKVTPDSGYKVNATSDEEVSLKAGEKATLSVEAEVDSGYTLDYSWTKDGAANSLGKVASLEITAQAGTSWTGRYRLDIQVMKDGRAVEGESHSYYFYVYESQESISWDTNKGDLTIAPGEEVSMYARANASTSYNITRKWYHEIASAAVEEKYNEATGDYEYVPKDPNFQKPTGAAIERHQWRDGEDYIVYYGEVAGQQADTLTVSSRKDGKYVDITGYYLCQATVVHTVNGAVDTDIQNYDYYVSCDTELNAHAKSKKVYAAPGTAAKLEVVAGNKNSQLCPITYQWQKLNPSTGEYEAVAGTAASLAFAAVAEGDYADYRVIVGDGIQSQQVDITLEKKAVDYVAYTPDYTIYSKKMGEKADLKVDLQVSEGTQVFYEWYRNEKHYYGTDSWDYDDEDWELLGQTANTYTVTLGNERDYTDYKCIATFKTVDDEGNNISDSHTFVFTVSKPYTFALEATKPQEQYKKVGSSADYGVRLVTDNSAVTDKSVTYQWYRVNEDGERVAIDKATASSYRISALKAEDFGQIICVATYKDEQGKEYTEEKSFTTYRYTDASLKENYETKRVALGSNVELKPVINNPSKEALSYQWYRYKEKRNGYDYEDEYYEYYAGREIIHGATNASYVVNQIGTEEMTRYECEVSVGGALAFTYQVTLIEENAESELTVEAKDEKYTIQSILGKSVELAVTAKSSKGLKLKYQWFKGGEAIGDATNASLKIAKVTEDSYGTYTCRVKDTEGNSAQVAINLMKTTGLLVNSDALDMEKAVGYETTFGGTVTLKASASIDKNYEIFYQWFGPDGKMLYGQTASALKITNITEDKLGYYSCKVYDAVHGLDEAETRVFYVYVNTGLVVVPSCSKVVTSGGVAKMFVKASANKGQKISYQWSKWQTVRDEEGDEEFAPVEISGKNSANYFIRNPKTEDYGKYRCVVTTRGEKVAYDFELEPSYKLAINKKSASQNMIFAAQGNKISLDASIVNPASDKSYTYTWYVREPSTENYRKISGTSAKNSTAVPKLVSADRENEKNGYSRVDYLCVIGDKKTGEEVARAYNAINVLNKFTYSTKDLPETRHPFDTAYDMKAYKISNATKLNITFDSKTQLEPGETMYVIDKNGNYRIYGTYAVNGSRDLPYDYDPLPSKLSVAGDSVVILVNGNAENDSYGYKVSSVTAPVPAKGTKYTAGNLVYKVTKSDAKKGEAAVSGVKDKKLTKAVVKSSIKIAGYTFKVTSIGSKAFKGCSKLKSVSTGSYVKSVGTSAFQGCKSLTKVKFGKNMQNIGASAFQSCTKLTSVSLGAKISAVRKNAFRSCSKLKSVTVGKGVKVIEAGAFANDKALKTIKITSPVLKSVGKKAFTKVPKKAKVTVPKSKKAAYQQLLKKGGFTGKVK